MIKPKIGAVNTALVPWEPLRIDVSHLPNFLGEDIFDRILYDLETCLLDVQAIHPFGLPPITRGLIFAICRLLESHHPPKQHSDLTREPTNGLLLSTGDLCIDERLPVFAVGSTENLHPIAPEYATLPAVLECLRTWRLQTNSRTRESLAGLAMNISSLACARGNWDLDPTSGQSNPRIQWLENAAGVLPPGISPKDFVSNMEPLGQLATESAVKHPNSPTEANDYYPPALFRSGCSACRKPRHHAGNISGATIVSGPNSDSSSSKQSASTIAITSQRKWAKAKPATRTNENDPPNGACVSEPGSKREIVPNHVVLNHPTPGHVDAQGALTNLSNVSRSHELILHPIEKKTTIPKDNLLKTIAPPAPPRPRPTNSMILSTAPSLRVAPGGSKCSSQKLKSGIVRSKPHKSSENTAPLAPSSRTKIKFRVLGQRNTAD